MEAIPSGWHVQDEVQFLATLILHVDLKLGILLWLLSEGQLSHLADDGLKILGIEHLLVRALLIL